MRSSLALAVVVAGCSSPPFPAVTSLVDEASAVEWRARVFVPPERTHSQHRALLVVGETEVDATLMMRTARPADLRIVGVSDLGATLFHLNRTSDGTEVVSGSPFLSDDFLSERLAEGLAVVFLGPDPDRLELVSTPSGATALHGRFDGREVLLRCDGDGGPTDRYDLGRAGRLDSTVRVREWARDGSGAARFPARLLLADARGGARLELRTLDWRAEAVP